MKQVSIRTLALLCVAAVLFWACGGSDGDPDKSRTSRQRITCEKDPELLDQTWSCFSDDDCPCGSRCTYGTCGNDCRENADCSDGEVCGPFGRCGSREKVGLIQPPESNVAPQLDVSPVDIALTRPGAARRLQISLAGTETPRLVVRAPDALELRCGSDDDWKSECVFKNVAPGEIPSLVEVRLADAMDAVQGRTLEVEVLTENNRRTVPVSIPEQGTSPQQPPNAPGRYTGWARPAAAGFASRSQSDALPSQVTGIEIPITAIVFDGSRGVHKVSIEDGLGAIFPDGPLPARIQREGTASWRFTLPTVLFAGPTSGTKDDIEVTASGRGNALDWGGGRLQFTYRSEMGGVTTDDRPLYVDWTISLARVGPIPDDASPWSTAGAYNPTMTTTDRASSVGPLGQAVEEAFEPVYQWSAGDASRLLQSLFCTPAGATEGVLFESTVATDDADNPLTSGELACANGEPPRMFGMLNGGVLDAANTVSTCLSDLKRADTIAGGDANGILESDGCTDVARLHAALQEGLAAGRRRALEGANFDDPAATALGLRALQKWLVFNDFLSTETTKIDDLNAIAPDEDRVDMNADPQQIAQRMIDSWDRLLHPRVGVALEGTDPEIVRDPDYRSRLFPSETFDGSNHDQNVGLPVAILDAAGGQLSYFNHLIEQARRHRVDFEALAPKLRALTRRSLAAFALAQGLYDDVRALSKPGWEGDWQLSRKNFGDALATVRRNLSAFESGKHPLGIEDVDLPIYRVGDQKEPGERFYAISDFLVGDASESGTAIAPSLVERASDALEDARSAWVANKKRDLRKQIRDNARDRRLETIKRSFGQTIVSLCGNPDWSAGTVLENAGDIDPTQCFLADSCRYQPDELRARMTTADIGYDICIAGRLRDAFGENISTGDAAMDELIDELDEVVQETEVDRGYGFRLFKFNPAAKIATFVNDLRSGGGGGGSGGSRDVDLNALTATNVSLPANVPADLIREITSECDERRAAEQAKRPDTASGSCQTTDACPLGLVCTPEGTCKPQTPTETDTDPSCYRGSLGEAAFAMLGTAREVDAAQSKLQEKKERYNIAMRSCLITKAGNEAREEAIESHNETMKSLERVANGRAGYSGPLEGPIQLGLDVAKNGVGSVFGKMAAETFGVGVARKEEAKEEMAEAERKHKLTLEKLDNATEEAKCFNDAEMHLVGTRTAALKIDRKGLELSREMVQFQELQRELSRTISQGRTTLQNERARTVHPLQIDFWLDEKIERYDDRFRIAKRATYLAVRAVEYEFQASLDQRTDVLKATTPAALEDVLRNLQSFTVSGTVDGGAPDDALAVVSLRDHLLQLADRSDFPDGYKALSPEQRFQLLLNAPSNAIYDSDGEYLGQELTFHLAPIGKFEHTDAKGVSLLTGTDCAERVWSINASLAGDDLYKGSETTFSRIVLRKRNTFYSQWCAGDDRDEPFQVASTRPQRNLFHDPFAIEASSTSATESLNAGSRGAGGFTNARVSAYFNVSRAELEDESYFNGDSQELAGRGLFGDYALFFPKETISSGAGNGLRLQNIEDVLLRFDYVSVAQH